MFGAPTKSVGPCGAKNGPNRAANRAGHEGEADPRAPEPRSLAKERAGRLRAVTTSGSGVSGDVGGDRLIGASAAGA